MEAASGVLHVAGWEAHDGGARRVTRVLTMTAGAAVDPARVGARAVA
jgi:hypothetical protein